MGGRFYTNEENRPCFQVSGSSIEEEIKTNLTEGLKIKVDDRSSDVLVSGEYLLLGDLDSRRVFTGVEVSDDRVVPVFAGEFKFTSREASLKFPSTIQWTGNCSNDLDPNVKYQYIIYGSIGNIWPVDDSFDGEFSVSLPK